jgi:hypothetical protein
MWSLHHFWQTDLLLDMPFLDMERMRSGSHQMQVRRYVVSMEIKQLVARTHVMVRDGRGWGQRLPSGITSGRDDPVEGQRGRESLVPKLIIRLKYTVPMVTCF